MRESIVNVDDPNRRSKPWSWISNTFGAKGSLECNIQVLDTLIAAKGDISAWYFTSRNGTLMKKADKKVTLQQILSSFSKTALSYARNIDEYIAILWKNDSTFELLNRAALARTLDSGITDDGFMTIQAFVQPRGGDINAGVFANFEHEFNLSSDNRKKLRTTKISRNSERIASMDTSVNKLMDSYTLALVSHVEKVRKLLRVVHLKCQYVVDDYGTVFFCKTSECQVIPKKSDTSHITSSSSTYTGPNAVDKRMSIRDQRELQSIPLDSEIEAILGKKKKVKKKAKQKYGIDTIERSESKMSRNSRRENSALHLGSSQLNGCSGDYCHVELKLRDSSSSTSDSTTTGRSAFYKSLASTNNISSTNYEPKSRGDVTSSSSSGTSEGKTDHTVPFKYVALGRVEKQLVDLFIRRYEKQEEGEYLTEEYLATCGELGQSFPGHYYQNVNVCANCYNIYCLVDEARTKSNKKISQRRKRLNHDDKFKNRTTSVLSSSSTARISYSGSSMWQYSVKCLSELTKADLAEFRSFSNPPPAVTMVATVLHEILTMNTDATEDAWKAAKKYMADGDKFLSTLVAVRLETLSPSQLARAYPYVRAASFTADAIEPVSLSASKFCKWIRALLCAYAWNYDLPDKDITSFYKSLVTIPSSVIKSRDGSFVDKMRAEIHTSESFLKETTRPSQVLEDSEEEEVSPSKLSKRQMEMRKNMQMHQMSRLAAPKDGTTATQTSTTNRTCFTCADGITTIPYNVLGQADFNSTKSNLVIFHDFFDTLDSTQILFRSIVQKYQGCRTLVFNYPGQAGTSYPTHTPANGTDAQVPLVLNNHWLASRVDELLTNLNSTGEFVTNGLPFHIVGFGNGGNIATCFSISYKAKYRKALSSLVLFNAFANVGSQLAAILHSAVNVFSCFPPNRPDLPVSYFTKFIFSDKYLKVVDPNLALNIYTAVTNAITLEGRVDLCTGALHHIDLTPRLEELTVPLILLQSADNNLVHPSSIDPFLIGRTCKHVWSHQQTKNVGLNEKSRSHVRDTLASSEKAAVALWIHAGHEIRQESKAHVTELLGFLVNTRDTKKEMKASKVLEDAKKKISAVPAERVVIDVQVAEETTLPPPKIEVVQEPEKQMKKPVIEPEMLQQDVAPVVTLPDDFEKTEKEFEAAMEEHRRQKREDAERRKNIELKEAEEAKESAVFEKSGNPKAIPCSTTQELTPPSPNSKPEDTSPPSTTFIAASDDTIAKPDLPVTDRLNVLSREDLVPNSINNVQKDHLDSQIEKVKEKILAETREHELEMERKARENLAISNTISNAIQTEQHDRRTEWEKQDDARLAELDSQLYGLSEAREQTRSEIEERILKEEANMEINEAPLPALNRPLDDSLAVVVTPTTENISATALEPDQVSSIFEMMEEEERVKKEEAGVLDSDDFKVIEKDLKLAELERRNRRMREDAQSQKHARESMALRIQCVVRGNFARDLVQNKREALMQARAEAKASDILHRVARGFIGRRRAKRTKRRVFLERECAAGALTIQRFTRGYLARSEFTTYLQNKKAGTIQRVVRGMLGRKKAAAEKQVLNQMRHKVVCATKIQATWKMRVARDNFLELRVYQLAALEIQRIFRGYLVRKKVGRMREWQSAEPGPARLQLGVEMVEQSQKDFKKQQDEMAALQRAQEHAEKKLSVINVELKESEKELSVLEKELQEIDQIELDLHELTNEAELLHASEASDGNVPIGSGVPPTDGHSASGYGFETKEEARKRQAEKYAVEMAIHLKRAEREKKKKELEAEFSAVFSEVQSKRNALAQLENRIADMEATRMRKEREFARLQRNLMELIDEQKYELEMVREKGIELETAVSTSAVAAAALAAKEEENKKKSSAMCDNTEELMKFQFMAMSLTYMSSLNMVKNLRHQSEETSHAAAVNAAAQASAVAAAASAANIPSMKGVQYSGKEMMDSESKKQKRELKKQLAEEDAAKAHLNAPFPDELKDWTIDDVSRWLRTLSLSQYVEAFKEAAVDGDFLMELRPEDMSEVLGMSHKLHVRKVVVARNKLLPLSQQEVVQRDAVVHENQSKMARESTGAPDADTVFSQARNGRLKRLTESIDAGFDVNTEDEHGNTLLLIACQNVNTPMVEMLLLRHANINHQNTGGNTALHFAMAYDKEGSLGEYLIERGADDTLENTFGLSPYDGLQAD